MSKGNKSFVKFDGGQGGGNVNFNSQLVSKNIAEIGFSSFGLGTPVSNLFTSTWTTTIAFQSITLPYYSGGTYSGTIDWGDGSATSVNSLANAQHTYASAGTYTIVIDGDCTGWSFGGGFGTPTLLTSVVHFGQLKLGVAYARNFGGCSNLNLSSVSDTLDLTGVTTLEFLFQNCDALTTINNINSWNTSAITNMTQMFDSCINFNQPLSFNTSAVTNMSRMFQNCDIFNGALNFNTISVTNMSRMFLNCLAFNQPLNFNTSAVTTMLSMFAFASAFNSPLTFTSTALVTTMASMFSSASAFNQPINFNTISVTNMGSMFNNATAFDQNLGSLNVANVTSFSNFMASKTPATFSTTNLDAIYNGWINVQSSRSISFGTAKYSASGVSGRAYLTGTKLWTIVDGGL
jgi:surface protein